MWKKPPNATVHMKSGNYITDSVVLMVLQKMGNSQFLLVMGDLKLFSTSTYLCDPSVTDSEAFYFLVCYKLFYLYWYLNLIAIPSMLLFLWVSQGITITQCFKKLHVSSSLIYFKDVTLLFSNKVSPIQMRPI